MVCHHLAKFGGHSYSNSIDIIFLICHGVKQDHLIKRSGGYSDKSPLR